jgi:broad specificity phosphatase PhoE
VEESEGPVRRWRGSIDVPPTEEGLAEARVLGDDLWRAGGLDVVGHDGLSRCKKTAKHLGFEKKKHFGARPWNMGPGFEGKEITPESLESAKWFWREHPYVEPAGGESFMDWYDDWMLFLEVQDNRARYNKIGIVTHNRNIQAVYATGPKGLHGPIYDQDGPDFLTVHVYSRGHIAPWNGQRTASGVYLIRHCATEWGT